jgi:predicted phosphohydrolase
MKRKHQTICKIHFYLGSLFLLLFSSTIIAANNCKEEVPNFWRNPGLKKVDITFVAFGDPQYGKYGDHADKCGDLNSMMITSINKIDKKPWPKRFKTVDKKNGTYISKVRGVLIAGDLTENKYESTSDMKINQQKSFINDYGLCGEKKLKYPVYEGYGNHDFEWDRSANYIHPNIKLVKKRNNRRYKLSKVDKTGGHYSWNWDGVHFVNLNVMVSNGIQNIRKYSPYRLRKINAFKSLNFLKKDLSTHVKNKNRPVVIMMHYPILGSSRHTRDEKSAFRDALKGYNVIAIIHGHTHSSAIRNWDGIPLLDVGSPFLKGDQVNDDKKAHFTLVRITDSALEAINYSFVPNQNSCKRNGTSRSPIRLTSKSNWYLHNIFKTNKMTYGYPSSK